jgi:hypothetical protein
MASSSMSVEPLILTAAELAVVFQHLLGPTTSEGGLLGELDLTPPALDAARARLLERGLLRPAPDRSRSNTFIAPGARALLGAATRPLMLCVLQVMRPGQDEHGAYFSWTPEVLVYNTVDAQGNHRLEPLPALEAVADRTLAECGLVGFKASPTAAPANPDAVGRTAGLRAIFMTVASARTAHEKVHGLAWLASAGRLWLMAPQGPGANGAARKTGSAQQAAAGKTSGAGRAGRPTTSTPPAAVAPVDANLRAVPVAELRAAILAAAQQAVDHTRAILEAAAA